MGEVAGSRLDPDRGKISANRKSHQTLSSSWKRRREIKQRYNSTSGCGLALSQPWSTLKAIDPEDKLCSINFYHEKVIMSDVLLIQ